MSLDITPAPAAGRLMFNAYGDGRFKLNGQYQEGSILVSEKSVQSWSATDLDGITLESLKPLIDQAAVQDILVIGCGKTFQAPPKGLREAIRKAGLVLEWMDTGAACRTFNVLQNEDRRVLAAIIAV